MNRFVLILAVLTSLFSFQVSGNEHSFIVVGNGYFLFQNPDFESEIISDLENDSKVLLIEETNVLEEYGGNNVPWVKIKTANGSVGYTLKLPLIKEDLAIKWKNQVPPEYVELVGEEFSNAKDLQLDLVGAEINGPEYSASFDENNYALELFDFKYNIRYQYVFFEKILGYSKDGNKVFQKVLDILRVDTEYIEKNSRLWLNRCYYAKGTENGSGIIGLFRIDDELEDRSQTVKPKKAWIPVKETGKLKEIAVDQIECNTYSQDDEEFPG